MTSKTRNPVWANPELTLIDCEIEHEVYGWIPFTASPDDVEAYGRELFTELSAGEVAPYVAPPPPPPPTQEQIDALRKAAYQAEADPLFFKWQRGESTEQAWLDKIAEIRARYPEAEA
jgi:hypothetical protein